MRIIGASTFAPQHDYLMFWVNVVTIGAFILVNSALIYFIVRYRKRTDHDQTSPIAQSMPLEIAWTIIPAIIMAVLAVWGVQLFIDYRTDVPNARQIQVRAKQWAWSFTYPRDWSQTSQTNDKTNSGKPIKNATEEVKDDDDDDDASASVLKTNSILYLEAGKPVKLILKSSDVIHSFFVPAFRVKEDVVPNIYTFINFTPILRASDNGRAEYDIFCTEYCGKDHSAMLARAVILEAEAYREEMAKIQGEASNVSVARGEATHVTQCVSCHTIDGSRQVGPSWQGIWGSQRQLEDGQEVTVDENYIADSIRNPNAQIVEGYPAVMPVQDLSDAEIESVILYIQSLK